MLSAMASVVLIVRVTAALLAPGVTELGEKVQVACAGKPLQARLTASGNDPPTPDAVRVYAALAPGWIVFSLVELDRLKSTPVPDRATLCALPAELVIVRLPVRALVALGVNTTFTVQLEPPESVARQLLVCL